MTYEDKLKIYLEEYDIGGTDIDAKTRFKLFSLICLLTMSARSKTPEIAVKDLLIKIFKEEKQPLFDKISMQCEGLLINNSKTQFDSYGYSKAIEMVGEVKRIIDDWIPF